MSVNAKIYKIFKAATKNDFSEINEEPKNPES